MPGWPWRWAIRAACRCSAATRRPIGCWPSTSRPSTASRPMARDRTVDEWKLRAARPDNHWLDCLVGCAVAASIQGACCRARRAAPARQRMRLSEIQRSDGEMDQVRQSTPSRSAAWSAATAAAATSEWSTPAAAWAAISRRKRVPQLRPAITYARENPSDVPDLDESPRDSAIFRRKTRLRSTAIRLTGGRDDPDP